MELTEKKLQELKNKKTSINVLNVEYFYTQKDGINVNNILKLLNENICEFKQIVDKLKNISGLRRLLDNKKLFKKLIENNTLNQEDARCLLDRIDRKIELSGLIKNTTLLRYLVDNDLFRDLVDKCESIRYKYNYSCLCRLLKNEELFEDLIENTRLNQKDLGYMLNRINHYSEVDSLSENTSLLKHIVDKNIRSFKELIGYFKTLLNNESLFQDLIQNNTLNKNDLRYLLNRIDEFYELEKLCTNTPLIKHILNEFILNREDVYKLNRIIKRNSKRSSLYKDNHIHTLFELIEYKYKNNDEILKLSELNKKVYMLNNFDLTGEQRLELIEVLKNSEVAKNRLIQIIDNDLESNYNFDSLPNYLRKSEKKNLLNI